MHIPPKWQPLIDVFMERNSKINLSAIRNEEEIYTKHILDALELLKIEGIDALLQSWGTHKRLQAADIGTWGWFPLLPLAMTFSDISRTWIDARKKKIDAINDIIRQLKLSNNCKAIHARVEEHKNKYDIITARAMAYSKKILPWIDTILTPWGVTILYKLFTPEEHKIIKKYWRTILEAHRYNDEEIQKCIYILKKPK